MDVNAEESVLIDAPAEVVWAYRLDYRNLPAYNPNVTDLEVLGGTEEPGVGTRYRFNVDVGRGPAPCVLTVRESVPNERIVNDMAADIDASEVCTFVPEGGGTRFSIAMTSTLPEGVEPPVLEAATASGHAQLRLELDNVKRILESRR